MKLGSALALAAFTLAFSTHRLLAQSAQFKVPITVQNGSSTVALVIGFCGDGAGSLKENTIGFDLAANTEPGYADVGVPPVPPPPYEFDARLMTIPGRVATFPTGLGAGAAEDYRGVTSAAQVDSFKIVISGDNVDMNDTKVTWPATLGQYATAWTIKPQTGSEWSAVDMVTTDSLVLPAGVSMRNIIIIKTGLTVTGVSEQPSLSPKTYALAQNFPNPFNPSTSIEFNIAHAGPTTLCVYNVLGQKVAELVNGVVAAGAHRVSFDGARVASGMYFYRLTSGSFTSVRSMILLK